ncbi:MAG: hypothetical protein NTX64_09590 [Elusimicrobia bacterium]|nr:hypothetical protein [Elusimicrobiota bacterium]
MRTSTLFAAFGAFWLAAPLAAQTIDFDQKVNIASVLETVRQQSKAMPSMNALSTIGNIWTVPDSKDVTLAPGQKESAYLDMVSTMYEDVCENPFPPYSGPICHPQVMSKEPRRFKLVLAGPIPASWGAQTFRIRLDVMRRPTLSVTALDRSHTWEYKLPEIYEDVLLVKPLR